MNTATAALCLAVLSTLGGCATRERVVVREPARPVVVVREAPPPAVVVAPAPVVQERVIVRP